jgi:hypothetical protein
MKEPGTRVNVQTELLLRILCDTRPTGKVDAAYLFAQTEPNQESVFAATRELLARDAASKILISDCHAKCGYIGATAYRQAMIDFGIPETTIEDVPMEPAEILHTLVEARAVVQFAKAKGYATIIMVSAPFHQERAFMTTVTAALSDYPELKVYSHPGRPQPWDETVTHSQGILEGTRAELIAAEQERIEKYISQGDLAPREKVLHYLQARD